MGRDLGSSSCQQSRHPGLRGPGGASDPGRRCPPLPRGSCRPDPKVDPGVDAATIVFVALAHRHEPPLPVTEEMLAWVLRDDPNQHADAELANKLLATRGDLSGHQGISLDLDADVTAPLIAAAAKQAQRSTGRHEVGLATLSVRHSCSWMPTLRSPLPPRRGAASCRALLRRLQRTAPDDSRDAWDTILFGPNQQLGGGYSRDVGWPDPARWTTPRTASAGRTRPKCSRRS